MKRRTLSLSLSLLLLAGCTPAPEPSPTPVPTVSQSPEPVSFDAFLTGVNEARRSALEGGEPMDISAWTSDFREQNDTFTEAEMERLLTPHNLEKALTMETAREDIETFFTLLRTTYGAYDYFGGDEVFGPLEEQAIAALESRKKEGDILYSKEIRDILYDTVRPVIRDGHFMIGRKHLIEGVRQEPYYVPDQYIADPEAEGLDPAYVKPTIGPDGAITYGFFALSHDGSDLPETLGGYTLDWQPCGIAELEEPEPFKGTASAGEAVVEFLRCVENVLVVGAPSSGCSLVSSNWHFYLPNTGIEVYFGTGLGFCEAMENRDGVGFLPDLWVNPTEAPAAVARLCAYYGLNPQ